MFTSPTAPLPRFYAYTVVDIRTAPPTPVHVALTRKDARRWVDDHDAFLIHGDNSSLRIRRTKCTLFER